jgi:hypothetical protein
MTHTLHPLGRLNLYIPEKIRKATAGSLARDLCLPRRSMVRFRTRERRKDGR